MSFGTEHQVTEHQATEHQAVEGESFSEYEHYQSYKSVCALAVVSLGLSLMSVLTFLEWRFGILGILAIVLGLLGIWQIKNRAHELAGLPIALAGVILSTVALPAGWGWLAYEYATEVPDGYQRISYDVFRPSPDGPGQFPPEAALALDGKKVFIKGYMFPSNKSVVKEFTLCRDNDECCFGGSPKPYDMIRVKMVDPPKAEFSTWQRKLAGTLRVLTPEEFFKKGEEAIYREGGGAHQIFFYLEAKHIR